ncbi:MAG: glutamine synthetase III [Clostridiales Family XIII bacterium]|jgi:glutamine synthetase|nr:glutamine synthetase III [Clostridiales Family XIII bacterium]
MSEKFDLLKDYEKDVFTLKVMKERLPKDVYNSLLESIRSQAPLNQKIAGVVATAMKEWAIEKGATHYSHWFQPMTGLTAEKQESFVNFSDNREITLEFSAKELIQSEPDASSFPSGGIRATFEARGYTTWDPTSPAFVKGHVLTIPTAFASYSGEALDKKTPLLRSMQAINKEGSRLLKLIGEPEDTGVLSNCGAEQEYFLIDESVFGERIDLINTGRTLFGSPPAKGQELDDHYYGSIKERVADYMQDLDETLWKLGVASKTRHNEVAPAQHEIAPIYESVNAAADRNQIVMDTLKSVAKRHGMVALIHEKPFEGVNGSGKHCNWSLATTRGENIFEPGATPEENARFLLFLSAVIKAVDDYQDLLRLAVASAANDHRLGRAEAPPAIISIFLGDDVTEVLEGIRKGKKSTSRSVTKMDIGVDVLPKFSRDVTDRNRTSPFAFTGNKFEFRMVGSSQSISGPLFVLNTIVADALAGFADRLEKVKAKDVKDEIAAIIYETANKHERIIFNGNNYTDEWVSVAKKRGLLNLASTPDALSHYSDKKNVELFEKYGVLYPAEVKAREELKLEAYVTTLNIEALTMIEMAKRDIIPVVIEFSGSIANTIASLKGARASTKLETALLKEVSKYADKIGDDVVNLETALAKVGADWSTLKTAKHYRKNVLTAMNGLRDTADALEQIVDREYWPLPSYGELLLSVK